MGSHKSNKGFGFSQNNKVNYGFLCNKDGYVMASHITINMGLESLT